MSKVILRRTITFKVRKILRPKEHNPPRPWLGDWGNTPQGVVRNSLGDDLGQ
jgi:hypothetical protein